ncbi:MAG: universal stress protein [Solirubrobacteraceae bacterium]|nr:universal stress protein [Solirubrobacteraceae bacterium]
MTDTTSSDPPRGPILLCAGTDAAAAVRLAEAAATLLEHRAVVVLAAWQPPPVMGGLEAAMDALYDLHADLRDAARKAAAQVAHAAAEALEAHGIHVTRQICPEEYSPWRMILDIAEQVDASVIVAGASEDAARATGAIGRQARALAHRTRRPLLLLTPGGAPARDDAPALFATDGSEHAIRAMRIGGALLLPRPAVVASVWQPIGRTANLAMVAVPDDVVRQGAARIDDGARERADGQAAEGVSILAAGGWRTERTAIEADRHVAAELVHAAGEHDAAVIVTGTRGRSRIAAALLGSTAESILRHAGRPVLLVPPPAGPEA